MKVTGGKGVDVVYDPVGMISGQYTRWSVYHEGLSLLDSMSQMHSMEGQSTGHRFRGWKD